jgi:hypothetical protein
MATTRNDIPTFDEVAADPGRARELPPSAIAALVAKCSAVQSAPAALGAGSADGHDTAAPSTDSLLTVDQAAEHVRKLGIGVGTELHHLELRRALNVDARR